MILSFRHKGLKRLFESDDPKGVRQDQVARLRRILFVLSRIVEAEEASLPGWRLHPLKGDLRGFSSITVSGNWRVVFRVADGHVHDVDLLDYH